VIRFGQKDATIAPDAIPAAWAAYQGQGRLALEGMAGYHRQYRFV
jgi:polyketide biosynthesis 3-hydroxy-3-methylglutaryl-CoA synthase-like enzyme PksG